MKNRPQVLQPVTDPRPVNIKDETQKPSIRVELPDLHALFAGQSPLLLGYQSRWYHDKAAVMLAQADPGTGLIFAEACRNTLQAATRAQQGGRSSSYLAFNAEQALYYLAHCAQLVRHFNLSDEPDITEQTFWDSGKNQNVVRYTLSVPSWRYRVYAYSAAPSSLTGITGDVVVDNAAYQDDIESLFKQALALTLWNSNVRFLSMPSDDNNAFHRLFAQSQANEHHSTYRITREDAEREGLHQRLPQNAPHPCQTCSKSCPFDAGNKAVIQELVTGSA